MKARDDSPKEVILSVIHAMEADVTTAAACRVSVNSELVDRKEAAPWVDRAIERMEILSQAVDSSLMISSMSPVRHFTDSGLGSILYAISNTLAALHDYCLYGNDKNSENFVNGCQSAANRLYYLSINLPYVDFVAMPRKEAF